MAVAIISQLTEPVEPVRFVQLPSGRGPDIGQQVTVFQVVNTMEAGESLVADVRGNWTPREMVERKLTALLYIHRPGSLSRVLDREWLRQRLPVSEQ